MKIKRLFIGYQCVSLQVTKAWSIGFDASEGYWKTPSFYLPTRTVSRFLSSEWTLWSWLGFYAQKSS